MNQLSAIIAPEEAPASDADCRVVLIADGGAIAASAAVGIKTRAAGWQLEITTDRVVTMTAVGRMVAVEVHGAHGQRYLRMNITLYMDVRDLVTVHPAW